MQIRLLYCSPITIPAMIALDDDKSNDDSLLKAVITQVVSSVGEFMHAIYGHTSL